MKQKIKIDGLNKLIIRNNYWFTLEQLERRLEGMLKDLTFFELDASQGTIGNLPKNNRNFLGNLLSLHFPFALIEDIGGLPSFISKADIELLYKDNQPTKLNNELLQFKFDSLSDVLKAVKGELQAGELERRAYDYFDSFNTRPKLERIFQIEQELMEAGVDHLLQTNRQSPFFTTMAYSKIGESSKRLFMNPENEVGGMSVGMFGTLFLLLFMDREIKSRHIHLIKTELIKVDRCFFNLYGPFIVKAELPQEQLKVCFNMENKIAEENEALDNWLEEHHHRILTLIQPNEEIEVSLRLKVKRKDYRKVQKLVQEALDDPSVFSEKLIWQDADQTENRMTGLKIDREGKSWNIEYKGRRIHLDHKRKGNRYLCTLLDNPDTKIPALNLYSETENTELYLDPMQNSSYDCLIDEIATKKYKDRLVELDNIIMLAQDTGTDAGEAQQEKADLLKVLGDAYHSNKKMKKPEIKKARDAVQKGISRVIGDIKDSNSELARYLKNHIETGEYCIYSTD